MPVISEKIAGIGSLLSNPGLQATGAGHVRDGVARGMVPRPLITGRAPASHLACRFGDRGITDQFRFVAAQLRAVLGLVPGTAYVQSLLTGRAPMASPAVAHSNSPGVAIRAPSCGDEDGFSLPFGSFCRHGAALHC